MSAQSTENQKKDETISNLTSSIYAIKLGDSNYESSLTLAENFKLEGNKFLQENNFIEAIKKYTQAIELKIETKKNAIYYSNRAFANLKLDHMGLTIEDANKSIEIDPNYYKAYYRRSSANILLGKYEEALKDLNFLKTQYPNDQSLLNKIKYVKDLNKKKKFFEIFSSEGRGPGEKKCLEETYNKIIVESSYKGIIFPEDGKITKEWVLDLLEYMKDMENVKEYSKKYIHKKYLLNMLIKVRDIYTKQTEALIDITIPDNIEFNVVGDIHGQYYDLLNLFKINGYPSDENPYLFNGDFVDRGVFSLEVITTLVAFKILYPNSVHLNRGNHESARLNKIYGFEKEINDKYGTHYDIYSCFAEFFNCLPLGHILNKKVLVVHGGLFSKDGVKIEEIKKINRFCEVPDTGLMSEILWADPCRENGRQPSKRGIGTSFGPDVSKAFLDDNGLELLIRSHESKMEGYEIEPCGNVITVFSAPNYCDTMKNKGAVAKLKGSDMKPKFITFDAVEHPKISIQKYLTPYMY